MERAPSNLTGLTFRHDGGLLIDDTVSDKLQRKALSFSAADQLSNCPSSWAAQQLLHSEDLPFGANTLGTGAHLALELFYGLDPDSRTPDQLESLVNLVTAHTWADHNHKHWRSPEAARELDTDWATGVNPEFPGAVTLATAHDLSSYTPHLLDNKFPDTTHDPLPDHPSLSAAMQQWRAAVDYLASGALEMENPSEIQVHATELQFRRFELPSGVPLNGFIDRVERTPSGGYKITDYKSGKYSVARNPKFGRDSKDTQIRLYAAATAAQLGVDLPESGNLMFIGARKHRPVEITQPLVDQALGWHAAQWQDLSTYRDRDRFFPAQPSPLCGWCPLANLCPASDLSNRKAAANAAHMPKPSDLNIPVMAPQLSKAAPDSHAWLPTQQQLDHYLAKTAQEHPAQASHETLPAPRIGETSNTPTPTPTGLNTEANTETETTMNKKRPEAAPSNELVKLPDGQMGLNLNSWAATRVFGVTSLAYEHLANHARQFTERDIHAFSALLLDIIMKVEHQLTGTANLSSGAHTRVNGVLRTVIEHSPAPCGNHDETAWQEWARTVYARTEAICTAAMSTYAAIGQQRSNAADLAASTMQAIAPFDTANSSN